MQDVGYFPKESHKFPKIVDKTDARSKWSIIFKLSIWYLTFNTHSFIFKGCQTQIQYDGSNIATKYYVLLAFFETFI